MCALLVRNKAVTGAEAAGCVWAPLVCDRERVCPGRRRAALVAGRRGAVCQGRGRGAARAAGTLTPPDRPLHTPASQPAAAGRPGAPAQPPAAAATARRRHLAVDGTAEADRTNRHYWDTSERTFLPCTRFTFISVFPHTICSKGRKTF